MLNKIVNSKFSRKAEALRANLRKRKTQKVARINQKAYQSDDAKTNKQQLENLK